ncbi:MAG: GSCFA domain-containing protein [Vicingus serpentipes]|nr:GSCFA domain-containing protein [Vicingus serpentipes]
MTDEAFFTRVVLPKKTVVVNYESSVFMIGSCFAQQIGEKLNAAKFDISINPNGIIYNPIAIANNLKRVLQNDQYSEKSLFHFDNKWVSFNHHGSFSSYDKEKGLERMNSSISSSHQHIKKSKVIFITFGSAWVYEHSEFGIVANCHKLPGKEFIKRLLSVKEVLDVYQDLIDAFKRFNPTIEIVFTVSPVRHIKDGLHENSLSKSVLHLVIKNLVEQYNHCHYFPAYEIVVDELRDYRFFKDDLVHPTGKAINYVWGKFMEVYCDESTQKLIEEVNKIQQAVQHRPFDYSSEKHQQFIQKQIHQMDELTKKYPFLDFTKEKEKLQER